MQGIKVQRYAAPTEVERADALGDMAARGIAQGAPLFPSDIFGGIIEPDDKSWIIWLDTNGRPSYYYPTRTSTGAVDCEPVLL